MLTRLSFLHQTFSSSRGTLKPQRIIFENKYNFCTQRPTRQPYRFRREIPKEKSSIILDDVQFDQSAGLSGVPIIQKPQTNDPQYNLAVNSFKWGSKEFHLLGVVHRTQESVNHIKRLLDDVKPDMLIAELDPRALYRVDLSTDAIESTYRKSHAFELHEKVLVPLKDKSHLELSLEYMKNNNPYLAYIHFCRWTDIINPTVLTPELVDAVKEGERRGMNVILADVPTEITVARQLRIAPIMNRLRNLYSFFKLRELGPPDHQIGFEDAVNYLKDEKNRSFGVPEQDLMLVFERDLNFIHHLHNSGGKKIVGIFGMNHIYGILKMWNEKIHFEELNSLTEGFETSIDVWEKYYGTPKEDQK